MQQDLRRLSKINEAPHLNRLTDKKAPFSHTVNNQLETAFSVFTYAFLLFAFLILALLLLLLLVLLLFFSFFFLLPQLPEEVLQHLGTLLPQHSHLCLHLMVKAVFMKQI